MDKAKKHCKKEKKKKKKKAEYWKKERTAAGELCRPPVTFHIKKSTHIHQHHCFLKPTFRRGLSQHFSSQMGTSHCLRHYSCPSCSLCCIHGSFSKQEHLFGAFKKLRDIYSCGARELHSVLRANLTWPLDIIAWPFYRHVVRFLWQSQRPTEGETDWACMLPPGFLWAFNFVPESPCGSNNRFMDPLLSARA